MKPGKSIWMIAVMVWSINTCQGQSQALASGKPDLKNLVLNKEFFAYQYPQSKFYVTNFSVLDVGIILIPFEGGVFTAGLDAWFIKPIKDKIIGSEVNNADTSLIILLGLPDKIAVQKIKNINGQTLRTSLFNLPLGVYSLKVFKDRIFVWGVNQNGWNIWNYYDQEIANIYSSRIPIKDLDMISEKQVLFTCGKSVMCIDLEKGVRKIMDFDIAIDGLAISEAGQLYLSCAKGVFEMQEENKKWSSKIQTNVIHGPLRIFNNNLFVLWRENNQILEIKLQ